MDIGKILGVRVRINMVFLFLTLAFLGTGMAYQAMVLAISVLGHEMAHIVMASGFGIKPREIEIYPFGGVLSFDGDWGDPSVEAIVAIVGPVHNLAVAAVFWLLMDLPLWRAGAVGYFVETNLLLGLFNLVPALPLDGGRVVRAMFCSRLGYRRATALVAQQGRYLGAGFGLVGAVMLYFGRPSGLNLAVMGAFLFAAATRETRNAAFLMVMELARKKDILRRKGQIPISEVVAHEETSLGEVAKGFTPGRYHWVEVVDDDMRGVGRLSETRILEAMLQVGLHAPLGTLLAREPRTASETQRGQ